MAKLDKRTEKMLEKSKGYVLLTENGVSADMQTGKILAGISALLGTMKNNETIDDDDIDKVCELAKIENNEKGLAQILRKLADTLEELED